MASKVAMIVGAGPGIGSAVAKRFALGGYQVCVARRNADMMADLVSEIESEVGVGNCHSYGCDLRKEDEVKKMIQHVESSHGPIECGVHNIGANIGVVPLQETSQRVYTKVWEMAGLSAFLFGREVTSRMLTRGKGTVIFTGATASTRGAAGHAAFSSAKAAKRALAQSMAREYGPKGIHVAHVIVDGVVDNPNTRKYFFDKVPEMEEKFKELEAQDGLVLPKDVAEVYWQLHHQPRSTWTHEVDIRPWVEKW